MEFIQLILTTAVIVSAILVIAIVDKKYQLGLNNSSGMWGSSSLNAKLSIKSEVARKDAEIEALKQRVAVLEKLVTDPTEQLKREIDSL